MEATEEIVRATGNEIFEVARMFEDCKAYLEQRGILQWDESYPNKEYFESASSDENLFVLKEDGKIVGAMVLDEWQTPEWESADWTEVNGNPLILHSFCVHPDVQGKGYGKKMLQFAEDFTKGQNYPVLRLDAYSGNKSAVAFYKKRGYRKAGEVLLEGKPEGHETYYCFEKLF